MSGTENDGKRISSSRRTKRVLIRIAAVMAITMFGVELGAIGILRDVAHAGAQALASVDVTGFPQDVSARMDACDYHYLVKCVPWSQSRIPPVVQGHCSMDDPAACSLPDSSFGPQLLREARDRETADDWGLAGEVWLFVKAIPRIPDAASYALVLRWQQGFVPAGLMMAFFFLSVLVPLMLARGNLFAIPILWPFAVVIILVLMLVLQAILWSVAEMTDLLLGLVLWLSGGAFALGRDGVDAIRELASWNAEPPQPVEWSDIVKDAGEKLREKEVASRI